MTNSATVRYMTFMMTIARCRYKRCPIEIVGEHKPECVNAPEGLAQTDCDRCIQEWLNEEISKNEKED